RTKAVALKKEDDSGDGWRRRTIAATVEERGQRQLGRWYVFVFYVDDESEEDDDDGLLV
nr:hypothetical protein [Tanacetum cinerariifolium]